jgi:hypothetical protein
VLGLNNEASVVRFTTEGSIERGGDPEGKLRTRWLAVAKVAKIKSQRLAVKTSKTPAITHEARVRNFRITRAL